MPSWEKTTHILPVIISNALSKDQEKRLIDVLKDNREAIGWLIADIKDISQTTCMHSSYLEEGAKPETQPQRRLNPPMMEVVKKDVMKPLGLDDLPHFGW